MKRVLSLICSAAILFGIAATSAFAAPRVRVSATADAAGVVCGAAAAGGGKGLPGNEQILLATRRDPLLKAYDKQIPDFWPDAKEAFLLRRVGNTIIVTGYDASGVLYGAMELADRIRAAHALPADLDYEDHPQLKIRGAALGLQKPEITYDGAEYDYRYMPEEFPWFYDKAAWTKYLDTLVDGALQHAVSVERPSLHFAC